ncbi:MAG: ABC transporter ATP-binding protein, partial [Phycisphaerae bacterium]|nr:ABC transporter ATP-binding protein [Gemmatimonadaceae bacterium]
SFTLLIPFLQALFGQQNLLPTSGIIGDVLQATIGFLIQGDDKMTSLRNVIVIILSAVAIKNLFVWLAGQIGAQLQEYVARDLRNALYRHLLRLPLTWFTSNKVGQVMSRMLTDVGIAKIVVTELVTRSLWSGAQVIASIAAMWATSWELTVASLVVAPLTIGAIQPVLKKLRRGHRKLGNEQGEISSLLQETVSGIRLVKSYGAEDREDQRFSERSDRFAKGYVRISRLALLSQPITETLGTVTAVVLLWYGAQLVLIEETMPPAMLVTFLLLVMRLLQPLKQLSQVQPAAQQSLASAERIFEVFDAATETTNDRGTISEPQFTREIRFNNVSFAYDADGEAALSNVSFSAPKGKIVALVGSSGAGKSTLVDLLPRFIEPNSGSITIDGVDLRNIRLDTLRALTGIVSQDTVLFNDTVRANVAFGRRDATQAQLDAAASAANALEFIRELPEGWDTNLGERGARLSGGQRQRLAIARALLSDPPILILDEATSALDAVSERLVQEAIDHLFLNRTVFVIAHRLATIQHADQILVLERGQLVEQGTHAELLRQGGTYARLHELQFQSPRTVASADRWEEDAQSQGEEEDADAPGATHAASKKDAGLSTPAGATE